jgi:HSP20 family molecular chaperone IbpA
MYLVCTPTVEMRAHVTESLVPLRSNVEDTEAKLRNGVLTITLPKAGNEGGVLFLYRDNL